MSSDRKTLVIILPNFINFASNGHVVALSLYRSLISRLGAKRVLAVSGSESPETIDFYREEFRDSYCVEDSCALKEVLRRPFSLLCPDDIEGSRSNFADAAINNKNCTEIYVIGFAPFGIFSPGFDLDRYLHKYDSRFRLIFYDDWVAPACLSSTSQVLGIYQETAFDYSLQQVRDIIQPAADICIYCGKGVYRLESDKQQVFRTLVKQAQRTNRNVHLITRDQPGSKKELFSLIARSMLMVCLDPFSHIEREALALGCMVWKPNIPLKMKVPGIHYRDLPLQEICSYMNATPESTLERKRAISATQLEYSRLLVRSSDTRLRIFTATLRQALDFGNDYKPLSAIGKKMLFRYTKELESDLRQHASIYKPYIHPVPNGVSEHNYPFANRFLSLASAINLLSGSPSNEEELAYHEGLRFW